jgi:hypothetical protein
MKVTDELHVRTALVVISAMSWAVFAYVYSVGFESVKEAPGVHLIYLPAGLRLLILLLFGVWGAIGIFIAHPIVVYTQYDSPNVAFVTAQAFISGFGGLFVLNMSQRLFGISPNLDGIRAKHLPLLSLKMAIALPLLFSFALVVFQGRPVSKVETNFWAMLLGDFLGCFIFIAAVLLLIRAYRRFSSGSGRN